MWLVGDYGNFPWPAASSINHHFVTVFQMVGNQVGAELINFVVLTAAASSLNSTSIQQGVTVPDCKRNTKQQSDGSF